MKIFLFATLLFLSLVRESFAQDSVAVARHKIAIFAPLYLDSAFDGRNEYKYAKNVFPKFINPGLEFYEGAQLALDSLTREGVHLEVYIYDTRSIKQTLQQQIEEAENHAVDLIIAHCSANELRQFSETAMRNNIPVINSSVPNDGGNTANPFFVVLNPTLRTQCEGIYKYVQRYYSASPGPIIVFRKKGSNEDLIKNFFEEYSKTTVSPTVTLKYVELNDSFTINQLKNVLDSNKHSVCIAGSLDANFGRRLVLHLATISKSYSVSIIGMPTWEGIREFSKPEFRGVEIIYSNPFYNSKMDKISTAINNFFTNNMFARPSDMVFRGYEITWKYSKLLQQYGKDLSSNLGNKQYKVFTDFDVQPVLSKNSTLQYFENKKLYFIKWMDGIIKGVN